MWRLLIAGLLAVVVIACSGSTPGPTSTPAQTAVTAPTVVPVFTPAPTCADRQHANAAEAHGSPHRQANANRDPDADRDPDAGRDSDADPRRPRPPRRPRAPTPAASRRSPRLRYAVPEMGAAAVVGRWEGTNTVGPNELGFIVTCGDANGGLECALDVPDQGLSGQVLSNVSFESGRLHFEFETNFGVAVWEGGLRGDVIEGEFSQAGLSGTFRLERASLATAPGSADGLASSEEARYREEDVEITSGEILLAGTLTLPGSAGPYPAAVLVSGSGGQNRDSDFAGFPVFGVMADHLTRHGIAVLRYDDPGVGGSTGDVFKKRYTTVPVTFWLRWACCSDTLKSTRTASG